MTFNPIAARKMWYVISGVLAGTSVVLLLVFGLPFGIDFTGGSIMEVRSTDAQMVLEAGTLRGALLDAGYEEAVVQATDNNGALLRLPTLTEVQHQELLSGIKARFGGLEELRFDSVGPVIGNELKKKSLVALLVSVLLIVAYITWMFRKVSEPVASWKYGVLTVLVGLHDILIPLGVFAVLGKSQVFQVDTAFVAAILTILGYSINDTIVVFDRTRENLAREGGHDLAGLVAKSLRQTYARSINSTLTTLLAILAVFLFGGETTRSFALALLIGMTAGAYSSIFIASPLLVTWHEGDKRRATRVGV